MPEDSDANRARPRLTEPKKPSKEEVLQLQSLPRRDFFPAVARIIMVPENRSRKAYTVVREIYLTLADSWWNRLVDIIELRLSKEDQAKLLVEATRIQKELLEIETWLRKPDAPLSLNAGLKMIENSSSVLWQRTVLKQIGKRKQAGQPASKRYVAVQALDLKCAYPHTSLMEVTKLICPCGQQEHLHKCREQIRQQVMKLVKFLREHGHDFRWDHISASKWEPPEPSL